MATEAVRRGLTRVFVQVAASNPSARSLYRRAGLNVAWPCAHWRPPLVD
ncbi:hypothetical protein [Hydrogenophaga sp.]|nr:hypothetical protein [Hydrogenophaga sp.]